MNQDILERKELDGGTVAVLSRMAHNEDILQLSLTASNPDLDSIPKGQYDLQDVMWGKNVPPSRIGDTLIFALLRRKVYKLFYGNTLVWSYGEDPAGRYELTSVRNYALSNILYTNVGIGMVTRKKWSVPSRALSFQS